MIGAIFPGQGSQHVGMCQDFYEQFFGVRQLFQEIEDTQRCHRPRIVPRVGSERKRVVHDGRAFVR